MGTDLQYKYVYTTIAVGESYLNSAINFAKKLNKVSKGHHVIIVTDGKFKKIKNTTFIKLNDSETKFIGRSFNYNLKYIPILEAHKLNFDYIFFFDSDWRIHDEYSVNKIYNFLDVFSLSEYDLIYERPHNIGESKNHPPGCFFKHKIEPYKLMETNLYDSGQVVNEQFLAIKNSKKVKKFCNEWKKRNEYGVKINLNPFAEGLEIGMSIIDAKMKITFYNLSLLSNCFTFTSNSGHNYDRF